MWEIEINLMIRIQFLKILLILLEKELMIQLFLIKIFFKQ
jgi:hypothetical protein